MPHQPFNEWLRERRLERELSVEECAERINQAFGTDYKRRAVGMWEARPDEDISRDRCRKVAHALQIPLRDVYRAARLMPDEDDEDDAPTALPAHIATLYAELRPEHQQAVDALIAVLHAQGKRRDPL